MKILILSSVIPKEISLSVKHNSEAANNFMWAIIDNLRVDHEVELFSFIGYPVDKPHELKKFLKKNKISNIFKQDYNILKLYVNYYKYLVNSIKNTETIVVYNLIFINIFLTLVTKLFGKKCAIIIADHAEVSEVSGILRKIFTFFSGFLYNTFSLKIVLSYNLFKKFKNKKMWLPGGVVLDKYLNIKSPVKADKIKVMYTGSINRVTGIDILLNQICQVKYNKFTFIFTGKGELQEELKEVKRENILFKGLLPEKQLLVEMEKANVFINPRNMDLPQNQNNFPSKIMEYLGTGRIVLSTKFPGWEFFKDNIIFYENLDELFVKLEEIDENYENIALENFEKNREFALNFEWKMQTEKIRMELEK